MNAFIRWIAGSAGHFGEDHRHKWWTVVLFWAAVAAAAFALLTFTK